MPTSVDNAYIKLESDGICKVDILGSSGEGSYEVNGSTVSMTIEDDTLDFHLENGKLSADVYGVEMVFEKR